MIASSLTRAFGAVLLAFALVALAAPIYAQQPAARAPSANAIALAKEIITVKGSANMYDPILPTTIDRARTMLLQTNPMLSRDLNEVAIKLRAELAPRTAELLNDMAKLYAAAFTEQELKEALTFYKSPLGKKITVEEPKVLERSFEAVRAWSDKLGQEVLAKMRAEMKKKAHDL